MISSKAIKSHSRRDVDKSFKRFIATDFTRYYRTVTVRMSEQRIIITGFNRGLLIFQPATASWLPDNSVRHTF